MCVEDQDYWGEKQRCLPENERKKAVKTRWIRPQTAVYWTKSGSTAKRAIKKSKIDEKAALVGNVEVKLSKRLYEKNDQLKNSLIVIQKDFDSKKKEVEQEY